MSDSISTAVKVASTPHEAKIYVAMLQAEGIPAFIDGASAADEFAISQRLLNTLNVKVMVPTEAVERAREILKPTEVDMDELTRQALAARKDPTSESE